MLANRQRIARNEVHDAALGTPVKSAAIALLTYIQSHALRMANGLGVAQRRTDLCCTGPPGP